MIPTRPTLAAAAGRARSLPRLAVLASVTVLLLLTTLSGSGCGRRDGNESSLPATRPTLVVEDAATAAARRSRQMTPVAPATRPTGPLPAGAACVTPACHTTFANAAYVHGPVSERACNVCHDNDIGGHQYPMLRTGDRTCTHCHAVSNTQLVQHKALEQGCTTCHDPHGATAKFLLKAGSVEQTCATCHQTPLERFAHDPFAKGACTTCHPPHQSEFKGLLRAGAGNDQCFACHAELQQAVRTARVVHAPVAKDCLACHGPHTSPNIDQLKHPPEQLCLTCHQDLARKLASAPVQHAAMVTDKRCGNCHDPHASDFPAMQRQRTDAVCLTCHDKPLQATDGHTIPDMKSKMLQKVLHGPNKSGNCSACHDPHGGNHADLLKRAFPSGFYTAFDVKKYALCFNCHEQQLVLTEKTASLTNFRNGTVNLHFIHVNRDPKGRTCKTCHEVHASDQPNHMASGIPFEGSGWLMPLSFEKTEDGGTCAPGCHTPRTYGRDHPTPRPTTESAAGTQTAGGLP